MNIEKVALKVIQQVKNGSVSEQIVEKISEEYRLSLFEFTKLCDLLSEIGISIIDVKDNTQKEINNLSQDDLRNMIVDLFTMLTYENKKKCLKLLNLTYSKLKEERSITTVYEIIESCQIADLLIFKSKSFYAEGRYINHKKFVVYKDAIIGEQIYDSVKDKLKIEQLRNRNINNNYTLINDVTFSSPSQAAVFICGYSVNGKIVWKNKDGITLKELLGQKD